MFITFEGPEGSGKSTQIPLLAAFLQEQGWDILLTREPGGSCIGDQIRQVLHDVNNGAMSAEAEILLYSASRAQLVREVIMPALSPNTIILCDRFYDSTLAYQGYGRGLNLAALQKVTEFATGGLKPDLTFLLDIPVEQGLRRRLVGGEEMNRLDLEKVEFHQRVRRGYHQLVAQERERWVVVNAGNEVDEVQAELRKVILRRLEIGD